jgi:hypothetical protein
MRNADFTQRNTLAASSSTVSNKGLYNSLFDGGLNLLGLTHRENPEQRDLFGVPHEISANRGAARLARSTSSAI